VKKLLNRDIAISFLDLVDSICMGTMGIFGGIWMAQDPNIAAIPEQNIKVWVILLMLVMLAINVTANVLDKKPETV